MTLKLSRCVRVKYLHMCAKIHDSTTNSLLENPFGGGGCRKLTIDLSSTFHLSFYEFKFLFFKQHILNQLSLPADDCRQQPWLRFRPHLVIVFPSSSLIMADISPPLLPLLCSFDDTHHRFSRDTAQILTNFFKTVLKFQLFIFLLKDILKLFTLLFWQVNITTHTFLPRHTLFSRNSWWTLFSISYHLSS